MKGAYSTCMGVSDRAASSSGKTLTARVAASMTGRCLPNDVPTFAISELAVSELASCRNSVGVEMDEQGRSLGLTVGPKIGATQFAYLFSSGRGAVRSRYATRHHDLQNLSWLNNAITSGELPLDPPSKTQTRTEGSQVRMIGLPVPPGSKGGIFNRVKVPRKSRAKRYRELAEEVEETIAANYGVAFPAFMHAMLPEQDRIIKKMNNSIGHLIERVGADDNPWKTRFARKLAIAGATAMLLAELKIAPWSKKRARRAFVRLYEKARAAVTTVDEMTECVVKTVRRSYQRKKYPIIKKNMKLSRKAIKRASRGFVRDLPGIGSSLLIPMARLAKAIKDPAMVRPFVRRLIDFGFVYTSSDGKATRQVMITGLADGRRRYVAFNVEKLTER
jgi:hypothetical protein